MKTTKRFLYFAAVSSLLFAACNRETVAPEENVTPGENNGGTYLVYFGAEAALDDSATGSKATLTEDVTEAGKTIFRSAWENGDQAYIRYIATGMTQPDYKYPTWDASKGMFSVPFTYDDARNWSYNMLYPALSEVNFSSNRTQSGNIYNSKYDVMLASAEVTNALPGKDDNGNQLVFNMKHQTGIAYFHFTSSLNDKLLSATLSIDPEGDSFISSDTYRLHNANNFADGFDFTSPKNSITITFDPENTPTADDFCLWFNVLPASYKSLTLHVMTEDKEFYLRKSEAGSYVNAKLYKVNKTNITWDNRPIYTVNTSVTSGNETGSIIATPSSAKSGTEITLEFKPESGYSYNNDVVIKDINNNEVLVTNNVFTMPESSVTVLASFKKADVSVTDLSNNGTAIANCYIVSDSGTYSFPTLKGNSSTENIKADVDNVIVLWESFGTDTAPNSGDLIESLSYNDGTITFTASSKKGNALIAARDNNNVILWSWHIWLTDQPIDQQYTETGYMMDRNLGATEYDPSVNANATIGLWYQWGRKDPFMAPHTLGGNVLSASKLCDGYVWTEIKNDSSKSMSIDESIKEPTKIVFNSEWVSPTNSGMWASEKTKYDPCPAGYKVCDKTFFPNINSYTTDNKVIKYTLNSVDVYYPLVGYRKGASSGDFDQLGSRGVVWNNSSGSYMRMQSYLSRTGALGNGGNANVRCQKM